MRKIRKLGLMVILTITLLFHNGFYYESLSEEVLLDYNSEVDIVHSDFCVIVNVYNPVMYKSRHESYKRFQKHLKSFPVQLITVELAFQNHPFHVTNANNPNHIQLRTNDILWYKENLINIGIRRAPNECVYIAWLDLEVEFQNKNWVEDVRDSLKRFETVQLFEVVNMMGPKSEILMTSPSFGYCYNPGKTDALSFTLLKQKYGIMKFGPLCLPGFAWASKLTTLLKIGGLFDSAITGDGDSIVAFGFHGDTSGTITEFKRHFRQEIQKWQENINKYLKRKTGFISGALNHFWDGSFEDKAYIKRRDILRGISIAYRPPAHVYYDKDGLLHFTDEGKDLFMDKILNYLKAAMKIANKTHIFIKLYIILFMI